MKKSGIFYSEIYRDIEKKISSFLNSQPDFLSAKTVNSPRAVGDAIQIVLGENFDKIIGNLSKEYSSKFARRAMADIAFTDKDGFYYIIDVETQRLDTAFNMPNIVSVERLARFYEDDVNYFVVMKVDYMIDTNKARIKKVTLVPIEFLSWKCLTLGALGWGQIQIANANRVEIIPQNSRKKWMIDLCDRLFEFYPREIEKINDRILYFEKVKKYWEMKKE